MALGGDDCAAAAPAPELPLFVAAAAKGISLFITESRRMSIDAMAGLTGRLCTQMGAITITNPKYSTGNCWKPIFRISDQQKPSAYLIRDLSHPPPPYRKLCHPSSIDPVPSSSSSSSSSPLSYKLFKFDFMNSNFHPQNNTGQWLSAFLVQLNRQLYNPRQSPCLYLSDLATELKYRRGELPQRRNNRSWLNLQNTRELNFKPPLTMLLVYHPGTGYNGLGIRKFSSLPLSSTIIVFAEPTWTKYFRSH